MAFLCRGIRYNICYRKCYIFYRIADFDTKKGQQEQRILFDKYFLIHCIFLFERLRLQEIKVLLLLFIDTNKFDSSFLHTLHPINLITYGTVQNSRFYSRQSYPR